MTVLELRFPAGRYHATPWGRHVNEGAVEWPPSPWRIVRALIATWYLKARRDEEISEGTMRALADALGQPPVFHLPSASTAHTRHYMPYNEGKNEKTTKVFDTFVQVAEKEPVLVAWGVDLPPEQLEALQTLAKRLGYLGRAESLVEATVLEGVAAIQPNATPLAEGANLPDKTELVRTIAPMNPAEYANWRADFLAAQPNNVNKKTGRKSNALAAPSVPEDLFAALHADTGELQSAGWNLPPGALYVNYTRPENAFAPPTKPRPRRSKALPTVARYAVASIVPPGITRALSVAEQIHSELVRHSNGHPIFTGAKTKDHRHVHIFCESIQNQPGHITHITVYAPNGFDESAMTALRKLQWTWGFKGHSLNLVLYGIGDTNDFDCALFRQARVWRSLTPFVSTRHAKTYRDGRPKMDASGWQIGSGGHDLLRLLGLHPQGLGATIKQFDERERPFQFGNRSLRSLQFQTVRREGGGNRGDSAGSAFAITFPEPVSGPFALGYGSHFGLGLFVPVVGSGIAQQDDEGNDVTSLPEGLLAVPVS